MDSLREAFTTAQRVGKLVMHVTLTDAVSMKEHGDAHWLPTMGWFYDQVGDAVAGHGGTICKYLNDGVVATFSLDLGAEAINAAIQVQERIAEAQRENTYRCNCAIGIGAGKVVEFSNGVHADYIGTAVDRSARLANAANAGAIFVDNGTVDASNMMRVFANYGNVINREGGQYLSQVEELPAADFPERIKYREILWAAQPFSVRAREVTKIVDLPAPPVQKAAGNSQRRSWLRGTVTRWAEDRANGFITAADGTTYFLHRTHLTGQNAHPTTGATVFFLPEAAHGEGRHARAVCALLLDSTLTVTVDRVCVAYGFHRLSDSRGFVQDLFLDLGPDAPSRFETGQRLEVRIAQNPRGPIGVITSAVPQALSA
ncbi:adenylate/guanylate cyclase domain-containing protein [Lentzea cavernae]|uniref:Adenylate cyclase, class 3 n=1 Tax=Lentzea cavernae TaxID=2020703 RepID=A0ABQ3MJA8_9PSEU|nr:adenylate/guanylate cyclase domain-containing protein [Lentzea cavernae]GHH46467.1 hypothetical protein GCM10017774_49440 [Lentzea cavernae]